MLVLQLFIISTRRSREGLSKHEEDTDFLALLQQVFVIALNEKLQSFFQTENGCKIIAEHEEIRIQDIPESIVAEEARKRTVQT